LKDGNFKYTGKTSGRTEDNEIININKRTKAKKKPGKLFTLIKYVFIALLIISALVCAALSPLFNIKKVEVTGAVHYNNKMFMSLFEASIGENGFRKMGLNPKSIITLRFTGIENELLKKYPYLKDIKIRFSLPSTVKIEVTERTPVVFVEYLGTSLILDSEMHVVDTISSAIRRTNLPEIKGLVFRDYVLGRKLDIENVEVLESVETIVNTISFHDKDSQQKLMDLITYIDFTDPRSVVLLLDSRILVKIGNLDDINYKISSLRSIYFGNIKETESGILDFTVGANPIFSPFAGGN